MKLTILTQYFPPEVGAPQSRLSHLASHFAAAGHEVTVLTAMPNYPAGRIRRGYGGMLKKEFDGKVRIIRTFIYPSQSAGLVRRLVNYFSFVLSSALFGSLLLKPSDFLLVESPPLFLGLSALWLSRLKRSKLIFNVSDLWPESAVRLGVIRQNGFAHRIAARVEALCYRHAWLITGQSTSILQDIENRFPRYRTLLLSNGADTRVFHPEARTPESRARLTTSNEFVVLYAGLHGLAQGLEQILEAAEQLQEEPYRFVLIGDGPVKQSLILKARNAGLRNLSFLDAAPAAHMPALLAAADLIVAPLGMHLPGAVPSKLYEAMASGRPIVLVARGEAAEIVLRHNAGIVVPPNQPAALVDAIRATRSNPEFAAARSQHARTSAVKHYDRSRIAASFIRFLESQVGVGTEATPEPCEVSPAL